MLVDKSHTMKIDIAARNRKYFDTDSRKENLKEKSVRAGIFTASFQGIEMVLRIASIAVLARLLIPEYFGLIGMVTAIISIAEQFKDFGLSTATIQQKYITHDQVSNLFWINVVMGIILMILISSASIPMALFFKEPRLVYITIALSTGFFSGGLTVQHQAILQRDLKLAIIGAIQITSTALSTAIAIIMAFTGFGYWALVWREVLRSLFIAVGTWLHCRWIPGLPKRNTKIDHMLRFGRHIAGFNIIVFFAVSLDQILIGKFYGPEQLGIYRQAFYLIFLPVTLLMQPLSRVMEPALSILQGDAERYSRYYKKMLTTLAFITMPLTLFMLVYSHDIIMVILGKKWIEAVALFRILAISALIRPVSDTTSSILISCGRTKRYFVLGLATAFILLVSFGIGIIWGARGVAYGYFAATVALLVIRLSFSFQGTPFNVKLFWEAIEKPLMSSIAMIISIIIFKKIFIINNSVISLSISIPVAVVTYLLAWSIIASGTGTLRELVNDLMTALHLDKYAVFVRSFRNS
jgi:O-antigen/teichoic acid export membrane protein